MSVKSRSHHAEIICTVRFVAMMRLGLSYELTFIVWAIFLTTAVAESGVNAKAQYHEACPAYEQYARFPQ